MEALKMNVFSDVAGLGGGRAHLDGERGPGARDQWLELFGQGRWADTAPGSGWLALQVSSVSRPEVLAKATDDEVLGIGRSWKALETWAFARKLTVVRELIRRHPLDERWEPDGLPGEWEPALHHEVAAALGISTVAAGKLVHLAWTLDARLPGIGQALEDNRLDPARVRLIVDGTSVLEDEALFPRVEQIILAGLPDCRIWSALERLVQRAVITVDPEGAQRRREKAEREHARLRFWRENCGTCAMQATGLPTDEALAANANIEARAREYRKAGVERPVDILRVMAYLDLLNGVTVVQRAAWAKADDAARQAGEAEKQASGNARRNGPEGEGLDSDGDGPDGDGPGGPDSGAPDAGRPGGDGHGGANVGSEGPESGNPGGSAGGYPGDWPADDGGFGDVGDPHPCPACGGADGGIGLPVRASLTVATGALEWLADWSARNAGNTARGPTGSGSGGGGHGRQYRGGPVLGPACGTQDSASMPARDLVLPLLTLFGVAARPGEAHGLGALDPGLVRDLAAAGARHPDSQFCITVTDEHGFAIGHGCLKPMRGMKGRAVAVDHHRVTITPSGRTGPQDGFGSWIFTLPGAPLPLTVDIDPVPSYDCDHRFESKAYQPSERLRHLVQVRDGQCSFPACSRQARESDFEHAVPHHKGGRTCSCNAHACSRSCHRAKQSRGWQVTKPRPGWTQWTTRAGRTYLQGPWRYPT